MRAQMKTTSTPFGTAKLARAILTGFLAATMSVVGLSSASATPTIERVSPSAGPIGGGTTITIIGTGFAEDVMPALVNIGGYPATAVEMVSDTEITAVTPVGTVGLTDIQVVINNGAAVGAFVFNYYAIAPGTVVGSTKVDYEVPVGSSLKFVTDPDPINSLAVGASASALLSYTPNDDITGVADGEHIGIYEVDATTFDVISFFDIQLSSDDIKASTEPTLSLASPANNVIGFAVDGNIVLTFSEPISKGTSGFIRIRKFVGDTDAEAFNFSSTKVTIAGSELTINPTDSLDYSTQYYVLIDAGAIKDSGGTQPFMGIADSTILKFTTAADTTAPVISGSATVAVTAPSTTVATYTADDAVTTWTLSGNDAALFDISTGGVVTFKAASAAGTYAITVEATNAEALTETKPATVTVTAEADTTAPTLVSSSPADNATSVALGAPIVLTFSENIALGTGLITLKLSSNDNTIEEFDVASEVVSAGVAGNVLTLTPTVAWLNSIEYYVLIAGTAITDLAGIPNTYAGISDKTVLSFTSIAPGPIASAGGFDQNVVGTTGTALGLNQTIITLTNATFKAISTSDELSSWVTNAPAGISIKAVVPVLLAGTSVILNFTGIPTAAVSAAMIITIPADALLSGVSLTVTANANLKFTISEPVPTDVTAPVLSAGSATSVAATTATLNFTSGEAGTYYYLVYAAATAAPTEAEVKAQGTALKKGSAAATAAAQTISLTGLTASTAYKAYVIVEDSLLNQSNLLSITLTTIASAPAPAEPTIDFAAIAAAQAAAKVAADKAAADKLLADKAAADAKAVADKLAADKLIADAKAASEALAAAAVKAAEEKLAQDKAVAAEQATVVAVRAAAAKAAANTVKLVSSSTKTKISLDLADVYYGLIAYVQVVTKTKTGTRTTTLDYFVVDREDGKASISVKKLLKGQKLQVRIGKKIVFNKTI